MSTVLYYTNDAAAVTPSSWSAGWNVTTSATTFAMSGALTDGSAGPPKTSFAGTGVAGQYRAHMRFVSPPLQAQNIGSSAILDGWFAGFETNLTDDYCLAIAAKVITSAGADRGILAPVTTRTTVELAQTNNTWRQIRDSAGNTNITLSLVAAQAGDRIVVEVGIYQGSTSTAIGSLIGQLPDTSNCYPSMNGEISSENTASAPGYVRFSENIKFENPFYSRVASGTQVPVDLNSAPSGLAAAATNATAANSCTFQLTRPGDLLYVACFCRSASDTWSVTQAAGQTWNTETRFTTTNVGVTIFWCTVSGAGGTLSLQFTSTNSTNTSVYGALFRGMSADTTWAVGNALTTNTFAASGAGPYTRTGITTSQPKTVVIASWHTADDNGWLAPSGTGWEDMGHHQRNIAGSDSSQAFAFYVADAASTATGNVSRSQTIVTGDAGITSIIGFYASDPAAATPTLMFDPSYYFRHLIVR